MIRILIADPDPATVIAGIYLLKRRPLGYLIASPLLILCTLIGIVVISQTISQASVGIVFPIGVYIGTIGSWVVMGAFAVRLTIAFFRNITDVSSIQQHVPALTGKEI